MASRHSTATEATDHASDAPSRGAVQSGRSACPRVLAGVQAARTLLRPGLSWNLVLRY